MILRQLRAQTNEFNFEIVPITTSGDKVLNKPIAELGSLGVFVKELEEALLDKRVDMVVHSYKDVPTAQPDDLTIAATLLRDDPRDVYVSAGHSPLAQAPAGAKVATSSRRRIAQLSSVRPDLQFIDVRGNVPTRLRKLYEGLCDGMVLAAAGLLRLGLAQRITEYLAPDVCVPAAGQAALAVQCRRHDETVCRLLRAIDDPITRAETDAERAFLSVVGGGCSVPIGVLARVQADELALTACISDGKDVLRDRISGAQAHAVELGTSLANRMLSQGADRLLDAVTQRPQQTISPP
jgi:hydroxymethylbilane synthase